MPLGRSGSSEKLNVSVAPAYHTPAPTAVWVW